MKWGQDVVDNESLGRRKSKKCCIFHKRRKFGESSSESEGYSSSSGGETDTPSRRTSRRQNECNCGGAPDNISEAEGQPRRRPFTQRVQEHIDSSGEPDEGAAAKQWGTLAIDGTAADGSSRMELIEQPAIQDPARTLQT